MRELHLFAGIGGGILGGMLLGHRCVGAVEIDPYCRKALLARQRDGVLPSFPILEDVKEFDGKPWRGRVDVVCGGFPCTPWSSAGKRLGTADPRHLWPEMARIIGECRPRYVFAENVAAEAFREPFRDLRAMGYQLAPLLTLSAGDLGAPFERSRVWLLAADADRQGQHVEPEHAEVAGVPEARDAPRARLEKRQGERGDTRPQQPPAIGATWRSTPRRLVRLVSGSASRVESRKDRIRAVGNAQVPAVAALAFRMMFERIVLVEMGA